MWLSGWILIRVRRIWRNVRRTKYPHQRWITSMKIIIICVEPNIERRME